MFIANRIKPNYQSVFTGYGLLKSKKLGGNFMACHIANKKRLKQAFIFIMFLTIVLPDHQALSTQKKRCKDTVTTPRRSISDIDERKQLAVDYSQVAKFKLLSRKKTYRVGDMINLDLALFNTSREKIFFRQLSVFHITLEVRDEKGSIVEITPYEIILEGVASDSYVLVESDSIITWTYELLAGCQGTEEMEQFWEARRTLWNDIDRNKLKYQKERFERDLFVNFGRACLEVSKPGVYTITATAKNDYVVVSPCEGNLKTVIGKITSAPLQITIVP
jgi:hypothetical protein